MTMIFFSVIQVAYLTNFAPCEVRLQQRLDVYNEVTTVILVDMLTIFSIGNITRFDLESDIVFLAVMIANLVVHMFFLVKSSVVGIK